MNKQLKKINNRLGNLERKKKGKPARQPGSGRRKKKNNSKKGTTNSSIALQAKCLVDPCGSSVVPGLYGSVQGYVTPFSRQIQPQAAFLSTNFYVVVWFPDFTCTGGYSASTSIPVNLLMYGSSAANLNTAPTLNSFGNQDAGVGTTYHSSADPAYGFLSNGVTDSGRCLGACIKATYVGPTSNARGLVYPLTGITPGMMLRGGAGSTLATLPEWLTYAGEGRRADSTSEVRWIPNEFSGKFLSPSIGPFITSEGSLNGPPSVPAMAESATGIGLLFWHCGAASEYVFTFNKVLEWKNDPASGMIRAPTRGMDNPSHVDLVLRFARAMVPGNVQTFVRNTAMDLIANSLQRMVMGGSTQRVGNLRQIRNSAEL